MCSRLPCQSGWLQVTSAGAGGAERGSVAGCAGPGAGASGFPRVPLGRGHPGWALPLLFPLLRERSWRLASRLARCSEKQKPNQQKNPARKERKIKRLPPKIKVLVVCFAFFFFFFFFLSFFLFCCCRCCFRWWFFLLLLFLNRLKAEHWEFRRGHRTLSLGETCAGFPLGHEIPCLFWVLTLLSFRVVTSLGVDGFVSDSLRVTSSCPVSLKRRRSIPSGERRGGGSPARSRICRAVSAGPGGSCWTRPCNAPGSQRPSPSPCTTGCPPSRS